MWWKNKSFAAEANETLTTPDMPISQAVTVPTSNEAQKELRPIRNINDRLSLPLGLRLPLATTISGFSGFILGLAKGSIDTGFRFRAENAHRLPKTQTGWFLYHKSKNYNMMLGGIKEGFRQAFRFGAWTGLYFVLEEGVDRGRAAGARAWRKFWGGEWAKGGREMRMAAIEDLADVEDAVQEEAVKGNRDCLSSMFAGLGTAGMFSAWNRFPLPTAARTAKMGAKAGLAFGLLQDAVGLMKGRRVGYVELVKRYTVGGAE
ncbi:hypothetical protein AC579_9491 [Pseudocercospora musae]|uniref:Uncharacterized protein n=1 Tax=Pseudocercospora musae TaxID=113226 RepID=A0A139I5K5_9PEZI|nr:hypothetical protein AC579_9491 [Pseudocercospora musae]